MFHLHLSRQPESRALSPNGVTGSGVVNGAMGCTDSTTGLGVTGVGVNSGVGGVGPAGTF